MPPAASRFAAPRLAHPSLNGCMALAMHCGFAAARPEIALVHGRIALRPRGGAGDNGRLWRQAFIQWPASSTIIPKRSARARRARRFPGDRPCLIALSLTAWRKPRGRSSFRLCGAQEHASRQPDAPAIFLDARRITFSESLERVTRCAAWLLHNGLAPTRSPPSAFAACCLISMLPRRFCVPHRRSASACMRTARPSARWRKKSA